ncbi:MAG: hypothetical protein FWD31_15930 [Planctomycetaceae bacterium]|nr:hypothetical protein [Planctomycetaceae bacterium]
MTETPVIIPEGIIDEIKRRLLERSLKLITPEMFRSVLKPILTTWHQDAIDAQDYVRARFFMKLVHELDYHLDEWHSFIGLICGFKQDGVLIPMDSGDSSPESVRELAEMREPFLEAASERVGIGVETIIVVLVQLAPLIINWLRK